MQTMMIPMKRRGGVGCKWMRASLAWVKLLRLPMRGQYLILCTLHLWRLFVLSLVDRQIPVLLVRPLVPRQKVALDRCCASPLVSLHFTPGVPPQQTEQMGELLQSEPSLPLATEFDQCPVPEQKLEEEEEETLLEIGR